ncbi:carbon-nitrogen hydrolase family protein [Stappia albiluteola]|nr:carbon-nitrogen hydrolase family protein [Stappia albiluteola]
MKVAACQMEAGLGPVEERLAAIAGLADEARAKGADIAVFPELATTGYGAGEAIRRQAETADGPMLSRLVDIARETDIAILVGLPLLDDGALFNASAFVTPAGGVTLYRKIQLYGDYEKGLFARGCDLPPVVDYRGFRLGLLICFDVEFPERVRGLARRGADCVLVATALPESPAGRFIATSVMAVRAFENQVFVVYANHAGSDAGFAYQGLSCIAAPDGSLLAQASETAGGVIHADLDPGAYEASRRQNPYLAELEAARVGT